MAAAKRAGFRSVNALAKPLQVSHVWLGHVISGRRPGDTLWPKIAEILHIHERWLRFGDPDVAPPWANFQQTVAELGKVSERVKTDKKPRKPKTDRELLEALLLEQREMRRMLERLIVRKREP